MIPKMIHYCWFGKNPMPETVEKCIQSWKIYCPDYKIILWNETKFNVNVHPYMFEAYQAKKWAFVSDLARLLIVYEHGGIYLDTDVELLKSLDIVRKNTFFFAIEKNRNSISGEDTIHIATGLGFGAESGNIVLKSLISEYDNVHFKLADGSVDKTPCPVRNSNALKKYGYRGNDELLQFFGGTIYPSEYFCPTEYSSKKTHFTDNTISIHHYDASWKSPKERMVGRMKTEVRKIIYNLRGGGGTSK